MIKAGGQATLNPLLIASLPQALLRDETVADTLVLGLKMKHLCGDVCSRSVGGTLFSELAISNKILQILSILMYNVQL